MHESPEAVLDDAPRPRETIVEDRFFVCLVAVGEWLHHPRLGWEGVIPHEKVWHVLVMGEWFWVGESNRLVLYGSLEDAPVEDGTVGGRTVGTHICPKEFVVAVN